VASRLPEQTPIAAPERSARSHSGADAMEDDKLTDISMKGAPPCGRCHMLVARYAPQVVASTGTYHRECYEAWYFGRHGRRPTLLAGGNGDRHRYQVREMREKAA
jgi:hypothetical protein